jgi:hypothetical protein
MMCLSPHEVTGPFFQEKTVSDTNHLDMLELFAVPHMAHLQPNFFFQQGGISPYWGFKVRESLNKTFASRWIRQDGPILWPLHSPSVISLDFFSLGAM